jgi:tetratricopeptide (TPR) repeat protein
MISSTSIQTYDWVAESLFSPEGKIWIPPLKTNAQKAIKNIEKELSTNPYWGFGWYLSGIGKCRLGYFDLSREDLEYSRLIEGDSLTLTAEIAKTHLYAEEPQNALDLVKGWKESLEKCLDGDNSSLAILGPVKCAAIFIEANLMLDEKKWAAADAATVYLCDQAGKICEKSGNRKLVLNYLSRCILQCVLARFPEAPPEFLLEKIPLQIHDLSSEIITVLLNDLDKIRKWDLNSVIYNAKEKTIYEILNVPPTIELRELRKAYHKYEGEFRKKANIGDKEAEKRCLELSKLKNKIWSSRNRENYDRVISGEIPSIQTGLIRKFFGPLLYHKILTIKDNEKVWTIMQVLLKTTGKDPGIYKGVVRYLYQLALDLDKEEKTKLAISVLETACEVDPINPHLPKAMGIMAAKIKDEMTYRRSWDRHTYILESFADISGDLNFLKDSANIHKTFYKALEKEMEERAGNLDAEDILVWAKHGFLWCLNSQFALRSAPARLLQNPYTEKYDLHQLVKELIKTCRATDILRGSPGSSFRLRLLDESMDKLGDSTTRERSVDAVMHKEFAIAKECRKLWAQYAQKLFVQTMNFLQREDCPRYLDDYVFLASLVLAVPARLIQPELKRLIDPDGSQKIDDFSKLFENNCVKIILQFAQYFRGQEGMSNSYKKYLQAAEQLSPYHVDVVFAKAIASIEINEDYENAFRLLNDAIEQSDRFDYDHDALEQLKKLRDQVQNELIGREMQPAIEAMNNEKWEDALEILSSLLSRFPNSAVILYRAALCELKTGRLKEGINLAKKAKKSTSDKEFEEGIDQLLKNAEQIAAEKFVIEGKEALEAERYKQAISNLSKALKVAPRLAYVWYLLSIAYFRDFQFDEADKAIDKALDLTIDDKEWENYARVKEDFAASRLTLPTQKAVGFMNNGDFKEALDELKRICDARDPENHLAWYYRAVCERQLDKFEDAEYSISKADTISKSEYRKLHAVKIEGTERSIEIYPTDTNSKSEYEKFRDGLVQARLNKSVMLMNEEKFTEALEELKIICDTRDPENHVAWYYRAVCQERSKKFEDAEHSISEAIKFADSKSIEEYKKFRDGLKGARLKALLQEPSELMNKGNFRKALEELKGICDWREPNNHLAWYYRAICEEQLDKFEDAGHSISKAIGLADAGSKAEYQKFQDGLKQAKLKKPVKFMNEGNFAGALDKLREICDKQEPGNHQAWYYRAICEKQSGELKKAEQSIDKAIHFADRKSENEYRKFRDNLRQSGEMQEIMDLMSKGDSSSLSRAYDISKRASFEDATFFQAVCIQRIIGLKLQSGPLGSREEGNALLYMAKNGMDAADKVSSRSQYKDQAKMVHKDLNSIVKQLRKIL